MLNTGRPGYYCGARPLRNCPGITRPTALEEHLDPL